MRWASEWLARELATHSAREFGTFVSGIAAPLGIGTVELADGTSVQGFVCEAHATTLAQDISHLGCWRAYLRSLG
ncbi:allophanate hydrolase-related protein [Rhodoferax ferrireducens]|uniref:allophanate hydrolase-related protein n=1 Tax=Rhodoferax ferrireducens TaxID=192843 RepID=UPI00385125AD